MGIYLNTATAPILSSNVVSTETAILHGTRGPRDTLEKADFVFLSQPK